MHETYILVLPFFYRRLLVGTVLYVNDIEDILCDILVTRKFVLVSYQTWLFGK